MIQLLLAAPSSGSGKTMMTCALLRALQKRGMKPCAFKCGPDYIDPMFHRAALGVDSCNLDLFLSDAATVRALCVEQCQGHDAAVCEGVMGFYDGLGGVTTQASAWHLADTLKLPVILVLRPKGASLTLAAQINGIKQFRTPSHLAGILLNDCAPMLAKSLAPMLERETGLPVLGCLPHMPQAVVESRHLGLWTAAEIDDISQRLDILAQTLEENVDLARLLSLCDRPAPSSSRTQSPKPIAARIAVAQDEAFCFTYAETLTALKNAGAELVPFSPLHDTALPSNIGGIYLPGGYPELHAQALAENESMRASIHGCVKNGLPTVAECGGALYLGQSLEDAKDTHWPMAGVLPGEGIRQDRLVRFGYAELTVNEDSLLFRAGESVPIHAFHYWDCTENGAAFMLTKPMTGRSWQEGFASPTLYAAFPHLYFAGHPQLAARFVQAAKEAQP